ncbi:hypothetical protein D3C73_1665280 [compost metagenome]
MASGMATMEGSSSSLMMPVEIVYPPKPIMRLKMVARSETWISRWLERVESTSSAK